MRLILIKYLSVEGTSKLKIVARSVVAGADLQSAPVEIWIFNPFNFLVDEYTGLQTRISVGTDCKSAPTNNIRMVGIIDKPPYEGACRQFESDMSPWRGHQTATESTNSY